MADSENGMTMEQRIMVQDILTRVWMLMEFNIDTELYEPSKTFDCAARALCRKPLALTRKQMDGLEDAINKI